MPKCLPEILAPAGDADSLRAALAAGADAIYFGLDDGFNARARAANFSVATLADTVATIHRANAKAYVTLNTLVFESELEAVQALLVRIAEAGVDAIIVQDPAVALLAQAICPALDVHASTQMTISSPEAARFAQRLGIRRVVVPRELSVTEIRRFREATPLELEVFIHGALCVSWSGQCLTSEAWGGRSANRGQCAQSCRLPYSLLVDGRVEPLGETAYLLSPKDLLGLEAVEALAAIGVRSLKIEGRLKGPEYVATTVRAYQKQRDLGAVSPDELRDMALSYSRGFSSGFLAGTNHQTLVDGRFPKHRGVFLGTVRSVEGRAVIVEAAAPEPGLPRVEPKAGMGIVFDAGNPEDPDEPGGPLFRVDDEHGRLKLGFGEPGPRLSRVRPGQRVWVTGDPSIAKQTRALVERPLKGRHPLCLEVGESAGEALWIRAGALGESCRFESDVRLEKSTRGGLEAGVLAEKLGALGGTPFHLEALHAEELAPGLHLPVSSLKALRRSMVEHFEGRLAQPTDRAIVIGSHLEGLRRSFEHKPMEPQPPVLLPLCRTEAQLEAALSLGMREIELDWMELVGLQRAVNRAREAGARVTIATVRIQKPGEDGYDARIARLNPEAVLLRHFGGLMHFRALELNPRPLLHGDFSLNVTNSLTAAYLLALGLDSLTFAHDLDETQLFALLANAPADRFTLTLQHHIATFHTEHCVYAHTLSKGRDFRTCGRPCEQKQIALRDRKGLDHPVVVDVGCRNTVFNAQAQSAASLVPRLLERGVRRFRVEFVRESREEAERVLRAYLELLTGRCTPAQALARASVHEQFGVTSGTMRVLGS